MRHSVVLFAIATAAFGCGGSPTTGHIEIRMQPSELDVQTSGRNQGDLKKVLITVTQVDVHTTSGAWVPVLRTPRTLDLLSQGGNTIVSLGTTQLPTGQVDGLELLLDRANAQVIANNGERQPLDGPDAAVVRVAGRFDSAPCSAGIVTVALDSKVQVNERNGRRTYDLRSTARIKDLNIDGACLTVDGGGGGSCVGVVCTRVGEVCVGGLCVPVSDMGRPRDMSRPPKDADHCDKDEPCDKGGHGKDHCKK